MPYLLQIYTAKSDASGAYTGGQYSPRAFPRSIEHACSTYYKIFGDLDCGAPRLPILHRGQEEATSIVFYFPNLWTRYEALNDPSLVLRRLVGQSASYIVPGSLVSLQILTFSAVITGKMHL